MATTGGLENEQDSCTCPICLETLKSPKSLPCLHTFCETCIGEFILSTEQRSEQKLSNYPCPVCRTIVTPTNLEDKTSQWAASLPHNFTISSVIDNSKSVKQECHPCKRRDKISEATQWCRDCAEALCEECLQFHGIMKFSADHKVIQIDEMNSPLIVEEPDLSMISDLCPFHPSKVLEAFCFNHQELCCVFCLTLLHRKCENVQVIEDIKHPKKDMIQALMFEVSHVKAKVETMMKEKRVQKEKLETNFTEIELQAKTFISSLKDKLDSLLTLFMKGLNITREESEQAFENKLKTFEKVSNYFEKLQVTTKIIQEHGTLNQMFIHLEQSKAEIKSVFTEASSILNTSSISEARLVKSAKLGQDESVGFIELASIKTIPVEMNAYVTQFFPPNSSVLSKTLPEVIFDNVILKHNKTVDLHGFDVYCGIFVSDEVVVVGGKVGESVGKLKAINILDEQIIDECPVLAKVKRLTYDIESESLFVSCYNSKLFCFNFVNEFKSEMTIKDDTHNNGGICISDRVLYVIVNNSVMNIELENITTDPLEICFNTNTECTKPNGLAINHKNNRLLYTSDKNEVVCTSLDGTETFRFKDEHMEGTTSLSVHSEGIIFVGDTSGLVHLISKDGKLGRPALNGCDKLQSVRDLCIDKSCSRLAVFGVGYIELYDVLAGRG